MVASHLEEVLELCTKIADMNKTVNLVHEVEHFIRKNRRKITKETKIARSKVRRTFGKLESRIIDMLMRLCNYTCPKHNVELVHQLMTALGYGGYEKENRFRQRTENTLKKWKRIKTVMEEEEELVDYSLDESGEGAMGDVLVYQTRMRDSTPTKEKTVASDGDPSHCMNRSDGENGSPSCEEQTTMDVSSHCSSPIVTSLVQENGNMGTIAVPDVPFALDVEFSLLSQDHGDLFLSDLGDSCYYHFNEDHCISDCFYDPYWVRLSVCSNKQAGCKMDIIQLAKDKKWTILASFLCLGPNMSIPTDHPRAPAISTPASSSRRAGNWGCGSSPHAPSSSR